MEMQETIGVAKSSGANAYPLSEKTIKDLDNNFKYHTPKGNQQQRLFRSLLRRVMNMVM